MSDDDLAAIRSRRLQEMQQRPHQGGKVKNELMATKGEREEAEREQRTAP